MKKLLAYLILIILSFSKISAQEAAKLIGIWECIKIEENPLEMSQESWDTMYLTTVMEFSKNNQVKQHQKSQGDAYYVEGTYLLTGKDLSFPTATLHTNYNNIKSSYDCTFTANGITYNSCLLSYEIIKLSNDTLILKIPGTPQTEIQNDLIFTFQKQ